LVLCVAGAGLYPLGSPHELRRLNHVALSVRIHQHRLGRTDAGDDPDESQVIERVVLQYHWWTRGGRIVRALVEQVVERAKWIPAALGLDEIVFLKLHLGRSFALVVGGRLRAARRLRRRSLR